MDDSIYTTAYIDACVHIATMAFIETPLTDLLVHYEEAKRLTSAPSVAQGTLKPKRSRPS